MSESRVDVVRAWKDAEYREGLGEDERAELPLCTRAGSGDDAFPSVSPGESW